MIFILIIWYNDDFKFLDIQPRTVQKDLNKIGHLCL